MLVVTVLVPLFLGVIQVALVVHVRTTLTAAAAEGARYAATLDQTPAAGVARTREQIGHALAGRYAQAVTAGPVSVAGAPGIRVRVRAEVPPLGLWGPGVPLSVDGHAVVEDPP